MRERKPTWSLMIRSVERSTCRSRAAGWFDSPLRQLYHARGMGQSNFVAAGRFFIGGVLALAGIISLGCRRENSTAVPSTRAAPASAAKVASLVPAATDLIVGMGAADHLVAVSH